MVEAVRFELGDLEVLHAGTREASSLFCILEECPHLVVTPGQNENQGIPLALKEQTEIDADAAFKEILPNPTDVDSRMEMRPTKRARGRLHRACDRLQLNIRAAAQRPRESFGRFDLHSRNSRQAPLNSLTVFARRSRLICAPIRCSASCTWSGVNPYSW